MRLPKEGNALKHGRRVPDWKTLGQGRELGAIETAGEMDGDRRREAAVERRWISQLGAKRRWARVSVRVRTNGELNY